MCAIFETEIRASDLEKILQKQIDPPFLEFTGRIMPYQKSFVLINGSENDLHLKEMSYSLVPSWANDKKVKFATHNARVESLTEKATWKGPLITQRCVVPLSGFFESVYEGPFAGNMVRFERSDKSLMFAGGLWDRWKDFSTGESFFSFAIVTKAPYKSVAENGHDRSPILLDRASIEAWLNPSLKETDQLISLLQSQSEDYHFSVSVDRQLKNFDQNQLKLF